ncbi:MAG TPA: DUF5110 domain-containing protein [Bryobacteraceae bacterium]|nr:DUF5110 domain-containing protein [Bryobacteraceae bacterium]
MRHLLLFVAGAVAQAAALGPFDECSPGKAARGTVVLRCGGGAEVRLQPVTADILRVRTSADGTFPESLTVRWGFVRDDWPPVSYETRQTPDVLWIDTATQRIKVGLRPFRLTIHDRAGRAIFEHSGPVTPNAPGGDVQHVAMAQGEHFYGLGFQRMALDVRGRKLQWWRAFRSSEATVPFFLSSRGYGFYSNNTYRHVFDFTGADQYTVATDGGRQDYYIIHGPAFRQILDRYTAITGKPMLAPRWALGIGYECRYLEEQAGVVGIAKGFRREDIPIDWIGLEPGWEETTYSMKWKWSPKRFPDPDTMIRDVASLGVKMGLWESGAAPKTGYTDEKVRVEWYRPRIDAAIRKGIKFFKQDDPYPRMISSEEMLEPELNRALGGSGVFSAAEMNNTTNTLYSDTAMREYRRVSGERAMIMFNGYNSSIASHRWPFTWEADFPLGVGALSASLSGHSLVSTRDRNEAPDGIHLGYLAPFSYLESWAYYKEPWFYSEPLLEMNRLYAKLRYRLIPYLYSSLHQSVTSGLPVMRPMVLEFQDDPETHNMATQFLLGDSLLIASPIAEITSGAEDQLLRDHKAAPSKARVYLPKGRWYDFWTGNAVESRGEWQVCTWPSTVGGPLWVRGGAIIPMGQVTGHSDQEPLEVLRLDVYPSGTSSYTAYEDDGRTYEYEKGAFATTAFRSVERPGGLAFTIGARQGSYNGMPKRRGYLLSVHTRQIPTAVTVSGRRLPSVRSKDDLLYVAARNGWHYEADTATLWIKPASGWRYDFDARGAGKDPDRDTVFWDPSAAPGGQAMEIAVALARPPAPPRPVFGRPATLSVETEHRTLIADGASTSTVTVVVLDASRRKVMDARLPVQIEAEGEAVLGCGSRICQVETSGGVATTVLTSTLKTGRVRIHATAAPLQPGEADVETVRGTIRLQASPPERVKLVSDGSWLPLRVNLYATIQAGGVTVRSARTRLRLHITGGSGNVPEDREVSAAGGIGVFPDVLFKMPPKYVMHVSGDGLEPATIPIY